MTKRKKPTNKEMVQEINYLGQRLMATESVLQNTVKVMDLYINFNKDQDKFKKYVEKLAKMKLKKDKKN
jgi:hypothetical protein